MGYTHYWTFNKPKGTKMVDLEKTYQQAIKECQKVAVKFYKEYGGISGYSAHCKPGQYGGIKLNGKGEEMHEDFIMREHFSEAVNSGFQFCKTARKHYDELVVACLATLKYRLGDAISVDSDGFYHNWADGVDFAAKTLRRKIEIPANLQKREIDAKLYLVK